jgi:hypothetical protein
VTESPAATLAAPAKKTNVSAASNDAPPVSPLSAPAVPAPKAAAAPAAAPAPAATSLEDLIRQAVQKEGATHH